MREIPYDRQAAVAYARRWALDRNPAFYNFDKIGGEHRLLERRPIPVQFSYKQPVRWPLWTRSLTK